MTDNGIPLSDEQAERWATIRKEMLEQDSDAFYAVHSDGFTAGWSAAMQTIRQKIMDRIDVFQETMNAPDIEPETLQELLHAQNGLGIVLIMIKESNQ
jgi:hypothetical protein